MTPDTRPVAVLAALHEEAAQLTRGLARSELRSPHLQVWEGTLEQAPVVLIVTGVGKVAAAMAAQFVCDVRPPRCLLTIGLAGATAEVGRGALTVGSGSIQHDVDARPITEARGIVPGLGIRVFPADRQVAARLTRAAEAVVEHSGIVRTGVVLTGDQIVMSREVRDRLHAEFPDGICVDMETAAVAQVAHQNGVPWGSLRITSDSADESFKLEDVLGFGRGTAADLFDRIIRAFLAGER